MIQVCIMGGHDGLIRPEKKVYLTLFGGCDLKRQTVARQILARRRDERDGSKHPPRLFFLTICGGVDINYPTLAEEFLDLSQMIDAGALCMDDWDRAMVDLTQTDVSIASFTLMGGLSECELPSENDEIESLALQRHLGNISDTAGQVLQYGIGQRDAERRATIRRAILTEA